jgi:hypothetical protein
VQEKVSTFFVSRACSHSFFRSSNKEQEEAIEKELGTEQAAQQEQEEKDEMEAKEQV